MPNGPDVYIETLRISDLDKKTLVMDLNRQRAEIKVHKDRRGLRLDFVASNLKVPIQHPSGATSHLYMLPRSLSTFGLDVLVGRYLHPGTTCRVHFRTLDNEQIIAQGKIARAKHLWGMTHEMVILFDRPLDLRQIMPLTEEQAIIAKLEYEQVGVGQHMQTPLSGHVLIVDRLGADRLRMAHTLRRFGLETHTAVDDVSMFKVLGAQKVNLVILDLPPEDKAVLELPKRMRAEGHYMPILAMLAEADESHQQQAIKAGCVDYLLKSSDPKELAKLIKRHLPGVEGDA